MKKVRIGLMGRVIDKTKYVIGGRKYPTVTLAMHEVESVEELRKVVEAVEEFLRKHFPSAEIVRAPALEKDVFGE